MDQTLFGLPDRGNSLAAGQLTGPATSAAPSGFGSFFSGLGPRWGQLSSIFSGAPSASDPVSGMMRATQNGFDPSGGVAFQDMLSAGANGSVPSGADAVRTMLGTAPQAPATAAAPATSGGPVVDPSQPTPQQLRRPMGGGLRNAMLAGQPRGSLFSAVTSRPFAGWGMRQ